jgi:hypothetical protein
MDNIDSLTALWARLTDALDYHAKKWYLADEYGEWRELPWMHVHDTLFDLGIGELPRFEPVFEDDGVLVGQRLIPDCEREKVIRMFISRDTEAWSRCYQDEKRAQLRFKI